VHGRLLNSGDDPGDLGERSTRPKSCSSPSKLGFVVREEKEKELGICVMEGTLMDQGGGFPQGGRGNTHDHQDQDGLLDKSKAWAMEVYKGKEPTKAEKGQEEDVLELDLEEGEAEVETKFIAIAVYYSQKSYNPKYLFSDMLNAWGIKELAIVQKLGDYCFKVEFSSLEERRLGSWRGDLGGTRVMHC
jgi:hypothetical protein